MTNTHSGNAKQRRNKKRAHLSENRKAELKLSAERTRFKDGATMDEIFDLMKHEHAKH